MDRMKASKRRQDPPAAFRVAPSPEQNACSAVDTVTKLQRAAGNAAVVAMLQRQPRRRPVKAPPTVESFGHLVLKGPAGNRVVRRMTAGRTRLFEGDTVVMWVKFSGPAKTTGSGGQVLRISGPDVDGDVGHWVSDREYQWRLKFPTIGNRRVWTEAGEPMEKDHHEFEVIAEGDELIPTEASMQQVATTWVDQIWGALNQGLVDFEHNSSGTDWTALTASLVGNLIWAWASFFTGGGAFLVSVAGIGVGTKAAANAVSTQNDFHVVMRADTDALRNALRARIVPVVHEVHDAAIKEGLTGPQTHRRLVERLLKPEFIEKGPLASVNTPGIAAQTEHDLFLRAGASKSKDWAGWEHGNWWVEYQYRAEGAMEPLKVAPFSNWRLVPESPDAKLLPIDPAVRTARDRLNATRATLAGSHSVKDWPLRKVLKLYVRGSYALVVTLDGANRIQGVGGEYLDRKDIAALNAAAGWDGTGQGLLQWVWGSAAPANINRLR